MSESQSRYSIVERLTNTKVGLLGEKAELEQEIRQLEQDVRNLERDLKNWEEDVKVTIERDRRAHKIKIENAQQKLKFAQDAKAETLKSVEDRVTEINNALERIEKISASAAAQSA